MIELNKIYNLDYLDFLKSLDDSSIDCFAASPPYWQLRDYGFEGQIGLEPKYQDYIQKLIDMMTEMKRALKPEGTIWINLGDTYSTQSNSMGSGRWVDPKNPNATNTSFVQSNLEMQKKSLILIPHRFAIRCIDELGLILRNDIIWAKRNGMPESVTDRFSKKHEFFFFFTKQEKYYFDLESVKDLAVSKDNSNRNRDITKLNNTPGRTKMNGLKTNNYDYKNPGDVSDFWDIPTKPNKTQHYAAYNDTLINKPIIAGCPKGGVVCDPFCGTGTTLIRAYELDRQFIGNDGKLEYVEMAYKNIERIKSQVKLAI